MTLALVVFGFAADETDPTLATFCFEWCEAAANTPEPKLLRGTSVDGISRQAVRDIPPELIVWDHFVAPAEEIELQGAMVERRLMLPANCPIAARQTIAGLPFGPLIVDEEFEKPRVSGVGLSYRKGIATEALLNQVKNVLDSKLGFGSAAKVDALRRPATLQRIPERRAARHRF
jgi:hypothetical protein